MVIRIALILIAFAALLSLPSLSASADPVTLQNTAPEVGIPSQLKPPTEDLAEVDAADDSTEEKPYDIPMVLNDSVESHIEYFKTRGREAFQRWLNRSSRYLTMMKDIFREKNLPADLVYVSMIESGFNPYAVSWAKAVGAWQFMPATGRLYGLRIDWWIDERKDPVKSTQAAAEHLKDLHTIFGSWPLALASYNAGAGKVQRAVIRTRSEDFWDLKASRHLKPETKNYIPKYMAATIIAKNPEAYGFTVLDHDPLKYDEVVLEESADLRLAARCAECSYEEIKELNPELKRWITPPHVEKYVLKIPSGKKATFLANLAAVPAEEKITWERHEVRKGETLSDLAKQYNTSMEAIRDVNRLRGNRLVPGKHMLIPVALNGRMPDQGYAYMTPDRGGKLQEILYRVRRGETLVKIAREHDVRVSDIRGWNKGLGRTVRAGQKIKLVVNVDQI